MKINYKKLITFIISIIVVFLIVISVCVFKIFNINMIITNEFMYWGCFKATAIIFSISLLVILGILIITLICKKKNKKAEKIISLLTTFVILFSVIITSFFSINSYKSTVLEQLNDGDNKLPEKYSDLIYFSNKDISYDIRTIENSDAKLSIVILNNDDKELSYYEIETSNPILPYIFEMNLMGCNSKYQQISTSINHDAINPEETIYGLDYYIYETELYYAYDQIPSHSQSEIYAKVKKSEGYSKKDFEKDILSIR